MNKFQKPSDSKCCELRDMKDIKALVHLHSQTYLPSAQKYHPVSLDIAYPLPGPERDMVSWGRFFSRVK
jgi:hypothetical protein